MAKPEKIAQVETYAEWLRGAKSVYLADYIGLDVAKMQDLRKQCRERSVRIAVVKNRLLKLAAADAGYEGLGAYLQGPTAIAVSDLDEVAPAKLIADFAKKHERPTLKAAVVDGQIYGPEEALAFAKLPSFEEVRAQVLGVISGPARQLVRMLATPATQLTRVLDARREKLG